MQLTIIIPAVLALATGAQAWLQDEQGVWVAHATIHDLNGSKSNGGESNVKGTAL
jgi:hypothetical protein